MKTNFTCTLALFTLPTFFGLLTPTPGLAAGGDKIFNAGMKGKKGSTYDGGHRVPFFLLWPAGGLDRNGASRL